MVVEKSSKTNKELLLEITAKKYVKENTVAAREGRRCIDGRYLPDQARGTIARPGGDFGYVMVFLALVRKVGINLSPEQCFNLVYNAVAIRGNKFSMHTDNHVNLKNHAKIGCAHIAFGLDEKISPAYNEVNPTDVQKALVNARQRMLYGISVDLAALAGEHQEQGVLVVTGTQRTVNPLNRAGDSMYFVYDRERDMEFMRGLVERLRLPQIKFEDFKRVSDRQLAATLELLAPGKPVYEVNVDDAESSIKLL